MSLKHYIAGTVASALLSLLVVSPAPSLAQGRLGILRSPDNEGQWSQIEGGLRSRGVTYQGIQLEQLKSVEDLAGVTVLFLPNLETLTAQQVAVLETWVKQGGQLIASGPIGRQSPANVRQSLRALLGAYWAFSLSQPTTLQVKNQCQRSNCPPAVNWVPSVNPNSPVRGGVLIPANLNSQAAATWSSSAGSPAVISTPRTVYFGWQWGAPETQEIDTAWLTAALNRPAAGVPVATQPPQNRMPAPVAPIVVNPLPAVPSPPPLPPRSQPVASVPPRPLQTPAPITRPPQPSSTPTPISRAPQPLTPAPQTFSPALPDSLETFTDPSEQTAPAGLEVRPGNQPITTTEANAMRQELLNLLGRFQSAWVAANATNIPINLNARVPALVAGRTNQATFTGLGNQQAASVNNAIQQAQTILKDFTDLVSQQKYSEARQRWLQARQLLWQHYPINGKRVGAEIRSVWLDRGTIVRAGSEQGLKVIFDQLAASGINTIFFETINAGYPIYPSRVAPQQNPLTVGWDPLASAVKLAHERGMELHAWIWTFAVGNQRHNHLVGKPDDYLSPVIEAYPHWVNLDNQGQTRHKNDKKVYLDPANREVRSYLLRMIDEIARYQVDGIQLDYIRYPFQDTNVNFTYGYGQAAREQFQQVAGVDPMQLKPTDGQRWQQWTDFRTHQINSFVAEVSQFVRRYHPRIILSAAVFPHPEAERVRKIQQHWEVWARRGDVDIIVPMTYALDTNRLQRITEPLTSQQNLGPTLIAPSVKVHDLPEIVAIDQIQALRDLPTGGYAIFAVERISNRLKSFFQQTQGCVQQCHPSDQIIPYRQPFAAAAERYKALKQEWSYLLTQDELWVRDADLTALGADAEELANALERLAANPSRHQLAQTQQLLTAFRGKFKNAMRLHILEQAYQVKSWDNRLAGLEMLLRYGQNKV